jgi:hypothetical protein
MVLPPDHIIVISCLDLDPRGLNVVFKILMFMSAGPLTTGYGKEEFTSTPAKSFSVHSVDPDTTINYSYINDLVLKCTIASFVQSCQTESNSIESEHVMSY